MPRYMALIYEEIGGERPTDGAVTQMMEGYAQFNEEAHAAGVVASGEGLQSVDTATTIHVAGGRGGDVQIIDAPYAEAKEAVGGYYLFDCADLDEAIAWAAKIPGAWMHKVELRPVMVFA